MTRQVLVTGAQGFIGRHIASAFRASGAQVLDFDIADSGSLSSAEVLNRVRHGEFDVVAHEGALTDTRLLNDKYFEVLNVAFVEQLASACAASRTRLVHASSTSVYGLARKTGTPWVVGDESIPEQCTGPLNAYARSKMRAEHALASCPGCDWIAFRYTNVFGSGDERKGPMMSILSQFIRTATKNSKITAFGDALTASRDFVDVELVVAAVLKAADGFGGSRRAYNLGSGVSLELAELIEWIHAFEKRPLSVELVDNPYAGRYQYVTNVDMTDTNAAFQLVPRTRTDLHNSAHQYWMALQHKEK